MPLSSNAAPMSFHGHTPRMRPHTDIVDNGCEVLVLVNMPGVQLCDIVVEVDGHQLMIHGRSNCGDKAKCLPMAATMVAMEFVDVEYSLTMELSLELDNLGIQAFLRGGVLVLKLPRRPRGVRRIPVTQGENLP